MVVIDLRRKNYSGREMLKKDLRKGRAKDTAIKIQVTTSLGMLRQSIRDVGLFTSGAEDLDSARLRLVTQTHWKKTLSVTVHSRTSTIYLIQILIIDLS